MDIWDCDTIPYRPCHRFPRSPCAARREAGAKKGCIKRAAFWLRAIEDERDMTGAFSIILNRHREERSNVAIQPLRSAPWFALLRSQ